MLPDPKAETRKGVASVAGFTDDEVYAGGAVEEAAFKSADTSKDWADPGTNHHP
jgi:hypothetical protein